MDISKTSNVASNLFSTGAVKDSAKKVLEDFKGQTQSNIERSTNLSQIDYKSKEGKEALKKAASKIDAKALMQEYALQFQIGATTNAQNNFSGQGVTGPNTKDINGIRSLLNSIDTNAIGYKGKPLGSLTPEEAKELASEDGFFGIKQTSDRIADFVILGGGDDIEKLQKGRQGIENGFKEAQKVWGGNLPDISKETLEKALEKVDKRIKELQESQKSSFEASA